MLLFKRYDNDYLIKYFLKVFEMLKMPIFENKDLKKLINLFEIEKFQSS